MLTILSSSLNRITNTRQMRTRLRNVVGRIAGLQAFFLTWFPFHTFRVLPKPASLKVATHTTRSGCKIPRIPFHSLGRRSNRFRSIFFSVPRAIAPGSTLFPAAGLRDSCISYSPNEDLPQTGWSLEHLHGEWCTHAWAQVGRVCAASGDPKVAVPRTLTHAIPHPIRWTALESQLPGISDAYVAPDASVLLAIQSKRGDPGSEEPQIAAVALFDFSGNKLGAKLLDLPPTKIIMAEWATGRFVQSWTESLSALQSQGLPAAIIKLGSPSK